MRFHDTTHGQIRIDGHTISEIPLTLYRDQFAFIPQKSTLFDSSIRENITLGNTSISESALLDIIHKADLTDLIDSKKESLDALVGDDGLSLSGGQKQRITIARALMQQRPILLMDEATSSLDSQSENWIQESICP